MYFNTYSPATRQENLVTARAQRTYNAVCRNSNNNNPTFIDFLNYVKIPAELAFKYARMHIENQPCPEYENYIAELRHEWKEIKETVREIGQPLHRQHVVYFTIIDSGLKCGETNNLVQRHCNIHRADNIHRMWYLAVENKEQARIAEHALHNVFDHARCMSRRQGKKDYYNCDTEQAQKFITKNAHKIYEAVMNAIGAEE